MTTFTYEAIAYRQRKTAKVAYLAFAAPAGQILQWARVDRLQHDNARGVQRKKNDSKTASIKRFLDIDPNNTIPTAITIALPSASTSITTADLQGIPIRPKALSVSIKVEEGEDRPGLIIDGQHRIYGIASFDENTPIAVVVMLGADDAEIAFQFLVINNKVTKVSPDHIKALRLAYKPEDLDSRLTKSARMRSTGAPTYLETIDSEAGSPFHGRLKWPRNPDDGDVKLIPPNAFEMALLYISNQELTSGGDQESRNTDLVVDVFIAMWRTIKEKWPAAWDDPNSKLLSKTGLVCMSQYVVDSVVARIEVSDDLGEASDLDKIRSYVSGILDRQEYKFWTSAWNASSLDTSSGREFVLKDLRKIAINRRSNQPWDRGLKLVEVLD